ncbi:MAG: ATPase domain-containing protein [Candidatus Sumerlaeaceae bacterium]
MRTASAATHAGTGINGLDNILIGGFPRNRIYLVEGDPGTGKTTLGMQFLFEGREQGERGLYVTLSETLDELNSVADSHGWTMKGIEVLELIAAQDLATAEDQYTVFDPAEVELGETLRSILAEVERIQPARVVLDSLSELRLLAQGSLRYRRQILALKQFFAGRKCTVLLLDDMSAGTADQHVQSLAHGVVRLQQLPAEFGVDRRILRIQKVRGVAFRSGSHDFHIATGGLQVYPRLVAAEHPGHPFDEFLSSGVEKVDALLEGGIRRATSTLFLGPVGSGKSTLAAQYAHAAATRGEKVAIYLFEEGLQTYIERCQGLNIDVCSPHLSEFITVQQIDPAELSPGHYADIVRQAVELDGVRLVVIDSLNGYFNAMPGERQLLLQLHELLSFLRQHGVTTLLTEGQHGMMGTDMSSPVDVSYLADTVFLLRYFEAGGEVRKAMSIIKNRTGGHERTIREFKMGAGGYVVGEPLREFQGVLTGIPNYVGKAAPLLGKNVDD